MLSTYRIYFVPFDVVTFMVLLIICTILGLIAVSYLLVGRYYYVCLAFLFKLAFNLNMIPLAYNSFSKY